MLADFLKAAQAEVDNHSIYVRNNIEIHKKDMKLLKILFCRHEYEYVRTLYGDEINAHNGKRKEYRCRKCGMLKWI